MIKLSDLLAATLTLDEDDPFRDLQINEAKRLEALDVPRTEPERKPLVDEGDGLYVVWSNGKCIGWSSHRGAAKAFAESHANETGKPHTVAQVMAPVYGRCPAIPVATFTPERPHEWVIYRDKCEGHFRWCCGHVHLVNRSNGWSASPTHPDVQRFATAAEAQAYIDTNDIQDAYPWAVPKLTS